MVTHLTKVDKVTDDGVGGHLIKAKQTKTKSLVSKENNVMK